jgi:hypothetical protein
MRHVRLICIFVGAGDFAVKKISVFLMLLALSTSSREVAALDLFESQTLGELPPHMSMPVPRLSETPMLELPSESISKAPTYEPLTIPSMSGDSDQSPLGSAGTREYELFGCEPALLESTGTWLRRGFWFAEVDAVLAQRRWHRTGITLMRASDAFPPLYNKDVLSIDGSRPGVEGAPRITVGRFLFRDEINRDHNLEFVAFGGGNWSQEGQIASDDGLSVPFRLRGPNIAFDGALSSQYRYDSWFESFELNYHVKQRMLKDRMELQPNGQWIRRAQPSRTFSYLAGLRYFNLDEHLNWQAFGIPDGNNDTIDEDGTYRIKTSNHMFGTQLGLSQTYETARWSIGGRVKGGMYLNLVNLDSAFDITNTVNGATDLDREKLSWIGEASLIGKYHIKPNFSLRAGLELMHISSVALAPNQIDFLPSGNNLISMGNESVYMGGSIGFEGYW